MDPESIRCFLAIMLPIIFLALMVYGAILFKEASVIRSYLESRGIEEHRRGKEDGTVDWAMDFLHPFETMRYYEKRTR